MTAFMARQVGFDAQTGETAEGICTSASAAKNICSGIKSCVEEPLKMVEAARAADALRLAASSGSRMEVAGRIVTPWFHTKPMMGVVSGGEVGNGAATFMVRGTDDVVRTVTVGSTTASKVLGSVFGGLGIIFCVVDGAMGIHEWVKGHAQEDDCELLLQMLRLRRARAAGWASSPAKSALLQQLDDLTAEVKAFQQGTLHGAHHANEGSRAVGNTLGVASGACMIAAPFTLGATGIVGAALGLGSAAISTGVTVGKSWQGYHFRSFFRVVHDDSTNFLINYAHRTGSPPELLATPGVFHFRVAGVPLCQFYMSVTYSTHDGHTVGPLHSCDRTRDDPSASWDGGSIRVEPGAQDITLWFDVRGGRTLYQVDRRQKAYPWKLTKKEKVQEVFFFQRGDGLDVSFEVQGPSLHAFVSSATASYLDSNGEQVLERL